MKEYNDNKEKVIVLFVCYTHAKVRQSVMPEA